MAKPSAWGSQQPQPQPPPTPPFVGGEQCPKKGHYGQKPVKIGCTSANRKLLSFAFGLHDFSTPTQGPSPLQGKGCNRLPSAIFSRHGKVETSFTLLIWLNEKIRIRSLGH